MSSYDCQEAEIKKLKQKNNKLLVENTHLKYKKWRAYTTINKKFKHLGYFEDEEEAYNVVKGFVENGM
jgi:cell division protein FtsB